MAEYNENNKFPFHTPEKSISICRDDYDDMYELNFIFDKVVERFPALEPKPFYAEVDAIQRARERDRVRMLKNATDRLLKNIKICLMDEAFVHRLHSKWGIGVDKLI